MNTKNNHYWLKSGSIILVQNFSGVLFGFGGFYLLTRMLDKQSYGVWTLFIATTTIFETARTGLVQNALIKYLSSNKAENDEVISSSFILNGAITLACMIINMAMAHYLSRIWHFEGLALMFLTYNIVYFLSGLLCQFYWIEQANLSFRGPFITNFTRQGLFFLYIAVCFFIHYVPSLLTLVYMMVITYLISCVIQYVFSRRFLHFSFSFHGSWIKKLFNYGKFAFGTSISSILSGTIDQMMLGAMISPIASGAFNVAARIVSLVDIPTNAIAVIVFPQSAKRMATEGHDAIKYLYEKSVGTILAILLPNLIFVYFFSGFVVHLLAGGKYADSVPILRVTLFYCLMIPFARQFGTILDSIGKPKITFILVVLSSVMNLLLNLVTIRRFGIMGAVYSTLFSHISTVTVMQIILKRELNVNPLNAFIYAFKFYPELYQKHLKPILSRK